MFKSNENYWIDSIFWDWLISLCVEKLKGAVDKKTTGINLYNNCVSMIAVLSHFVSIVYIHFGDPVPCEL